MNENLLKLLPHKRQLTKIEKYKNENKGCGIDLSYKQLLQNHPRLPFLSLLDKFEIDKNLTLLEFTIHLSPLQKVKTN